MKKVAVLNASSIRSFKPRLFDALSLYEIIEGTAEKYSFKSYPTAKDMQAQPPPPTSFTYGKMKRRDGHEIVIDQLLVTYLDRATAIGVSTKSSTDDTELFLDDLVEWAKAQYGIDTTEVFPRAYYSQLEITFDNRPLATRASFAHAINDIGQLITTRIEEYGHKNCPPFELSGFSMHIDNSSRVPPELLLAFSIERRVGASYGENRYFSQAPLRTQDHKAILEHLDSEL